MSEYIYYCKFSAGMLVLCSLIFCYISEWSERNIRSYFFLIFAHFAGGGGGRVAANFKTRESGRLSTRT